MGQVPCVVFLRSMSPPKKKDYSDLTFYKMEPAHHEPPVAFPKLAVPDPHHKGSSGRICVVGGSEDYTGAPYLAAMASVRAGADLAYVLCPPEAAIPIKSYSPDLVVRPIFKDEEMLSVFSTILKCHVAVVGPGMGNSVAARGLASEVIRHAAVKGIPVVVDADGLGVFMQSPTILLSPPGAQSDYSPDVILTPNFNEFKGLFAACAAVRPTAAPDGTFFQPPPATSPVEDMLRYCAQITRATVLLKGEYDICAMRPQHPQDILSAPVYNCTEATPVFRRAGGQGDVFSGVIAAFLAWKNISKARVSLPTVAAACAASSVMRLAQGAAFSQFKRGYVASDLLALLPAAVEAYFSAGN